ncbi:SDR family oxidoreductase [Nocardiopsis quinghaiensis]|uniref:SDR family oxidoreductase n=1 Tax=Nocardiopsis quinghaiensis TaxID=464995 RepID=UPI001CC24503|nr:SDR family oxidoreductase [Nocardiopsis quinghaiensis]
MTISPSARAVMVTGASSGLGREAALHLEDRGFHVVAGVRRAEDGEKLVAESLHGRLVHRLVDVTHEESVTACAQFCEREFGGLWGLVNNAGICVSAPLEAVSSERMRDQMETNVVGQLAMIRAHLPLLRRQRGRVVNVTSGLGKVAIPYLGAYAAAQFAKEAMSDALRREVAPSGVRVSVVQPGAVLTPIWGKVSDVGSRALRDAPPEVAALYRITFERFLEANAQQAANSGTTPEDFARAVARALTEESPRTRYRVGADSRLVNALARALPDRLLDRYFSGIVTP